MPVNPYAIGNTVEEYRIEELLGEGSFANVFKVFSEDREKHYVLKVIMPQDSNKRPQKPFKIELNALDEIRKLGTHTHIVGLEKWGRLHETKDPYVLLEFIDGETVTARVKRSQTLPRVDVVEIQQIILQLLDALQFMHRRVIHRDIKPNNLMLSPSRGVVVIDFNVSKVMLPGESKTIVGTPPYIPPEILLEKGNWTPASDLYAVGILLYYLLTGEEDPYPNHGARLLRATKPANPKDRIPTLPDSIVRTMMKAIAYEPSQRYQDAEEMKIDVENWFPANIEELIQRVQALRDRIVEGLQTQLADGDRATLEDALKDLDQILAEPAAYDPEHDLLDEIEAITEEILEPQGDDIILDGDGFPHEEYDPEPPENEPEPELEEDPVVDKSRGKLNQIRNPRDAGDYDAAREALETLRQEARSDAEALALLEGEEAEIQTAQNMAFGKLIENARNAIKQNHFNEAKKALEEARKLDPNSNELKKLASEINKGKNVYLDSLEKSVREKLAEVTDSSLEEKELEELLEEVSLLIDEYEQKGTQQNAVNKVQEWRKQLSQIQKNSEAFKVQQARVQCERLWSEGGVPNALEALNLVYALQENLKEPKHPAVLKLREEAEEKYKMFRTEAGVLLTAAITGRFQELIEEYEKKRDEGIKYVPLFTPERDKDGKLTIKSEEEAQSELLESARLEETWEVIKAIPELQSIARDYARQKAEEKKTEAEKYLVVSPRRTKEILEETLGLYLLATEDREKIEQFLQNAVAPAVQRREEAEKLRDGAELLGPLEGWQQLQEALNHDPHVPGIPEVRARLRPRFQQRVEQELERLQREIDVPRAYLGQEKFQNLYNDARTRAAELASASGQDDTLVSLTTQLETFIAAAKNDIEEYAYVSQEIAYMRQYMDQRNYRLANEAFARIEQKLGKEALKSYPELLGIQSQLEARGDVDALIARIEADLGAPDDRLAQYIKDLDEALAIHPDHLKIPPLLRRARSRLNYRSGRAFFNQRQYQEARPLLEAAEGEDRAEADKLIKELDDAEHEKGKLERALNQAKKSREAGLWRQAYNNLIPWVEKPRARELDNRFWQEYSDTKEEWEQYAINELDTLSRQTPLNEKRIREQLEALTELGSSQLDHWQKEGLARCYEQTANEKARRGRLQDSIVAWQEAIRLDPGNEAYEEALIKAEKSQVEQQVNAAPSDLEQAERLYKHLRVRYSEDIDIRLKLANVYLKQEKFAETEFELNWVATAIRQLGPHADPDLVQDKEKLKQALEREQDIHRRQRTIEPMLHPARERDDYQTAKEKYEALKAQYPDASRLMPWWDSIVQLLAQALEKQTADLLDANEPLWKAAAPVLKILVLQPQNGYARRLISQLAHQVLTLATRIDQMLADTIGRYDVDPERALAQQITETGDLLEEVGAYIFALRHHTGQLNDGQERQNELQQYRVLLNQRLKDLKSLQSLLQQGYNQLEKSKTSGEWTAVDRIQAQIVQGEFGGHHTVSLFLNELNRAKLTRQQLQQKVTELKQALEFEAFEQALQLVADLQGLDPDDDFTVYGSSSFVTKLRSRPIGFSELNRVISHHLSDLKKLSDWLSPALKITVWWPPLLPDDIPADGNLAGLNELLAQWLAPQAVPPQDGAEALKIWKETTRYALPAIRRYKSEGRFKEAMELCADVLGEDGRIQVQSSDFVGRYTLNHIYNHLGRSLVFESPDVQSTHRRLAQQHGEAVRERLFSWLTQARQEQANMASAEIEFRKLLRELRNKVNQYSTAWPWDKGRIRNEGIAIFEQAKRICPHYRGLDSLLSLLDG